MRLRLPCLRPLQWAKVFAAVWCVAAVGWTVWPSGRSRGRYDAAAERADLELRARLGPETLASLAGIARGVAEVNKVIDTEVGVLSQLASEGDIIDGIIKRDSGAHRAAAAHMHVPAAPPTEARPREMPKIGDPGGKTSVAPADMATMAPIPVLMIACNRVSVERALNLVVRDRPSPARFPLILSQDCQGTKGYDETKAVLQTYVEQHGAELYQQDNQTDPLHNRPKKEQKRWSGYYKIARHYEFALRKVFAHDAKFDSVIIVEDDLDVAPDVFEYFAQGRQLLKADPTLFCVSAWNDNGKAQHVADPRRIYRTDFFPGLGWMILRELWEGELAAKWTDRFWDDWMRLPAQRKGRSCLRPEVGRTRTFGEKGVSRGQFFKKYLKFVKLNDEKVEFTKLDMSGLLKRNYDQPFLDEVAALERIELTDVFAGRLKTDRAYRIEYDSNANFRRVAKALGIMDDNKEGIFRTAYLGIVSIVWRRTGHEEDIPVRLHIAPRRPWYGYQP